MRKNYGYGIGICFLILLFGLGYSLKSTPFIDLTTHKNHTLTPVTQTLLKSFTAPLQFTLTTSDPDLHQNFIFFLEKFAAINKNIKSEIRWVSNVDSTKPYAHEVLEVTYNQKTEVISLLQKPLNEITMQNVLIRLQQGQEHWIVFLSGHGEPALLGDSPKDFGNLAKALKSQGLKVANLNLATTGFIPDNTSLLIIVDPQTAWLPKEEEQIAHYIKQGGALLWLKDFQGKTPQVLSKLLGVEVLPGIIVDQHGYALGTPHPAITLITEFSNPILPQPMQICAFPWAQALKLSESSWNAIPILKTHPQTWTARGKLEGAIEFNAQRGEIQGPLLLGVTLEKTHSQRNSRIVVIGNHRFATNAVIHNYGNMTLSLNLFNWLIGENGLTKIEYSSQKDALFQIPAWYAFVLKFGFGLFLPLLILGLSFIFHKRTNLRATYR
ncbi:MAG TPA: Gldg family protein [Gammaproteobacteria bacterium]|nr:Gldg family protein [Gammaproteobacteria bacterium]